MAKKPLIFTQIGLAITVAKRIANKGYEVIAAKHAENSFRVYVGKETHSVVGEVVYTNLWN